MGACLSYAKPIVKLNGKIVRNWQFKKIKNYKDAFAFVDITIGDNAQVTVLSNKKYTQVFAYERFQIAESIRVGNKLVTIKRLYGKR
jgi:hypothetical protein